MTYTKSKIIEIVRTLAAECALADLDSRQIEYFLNGFAILFRESNRRFNEAKFRAYFDERYAVETGTRGLINMHPTESVRTKMLPTWCHSSQHPDNDSWTALYFDDNTCECGIKKHHYHCSVCRQVTQVG